MSTSVKHFPIRRSIDEKWEVEMRDGNWVECETEEDANILSNAEVIKTESYKTKLPNKLLATKLAKTAEKLEQYNMGSAARFFKSRAKLARRERNDGK